MADAIAPAPGFARLGADAERLAALYPVNRAPAPLPWLPAAIEIPDGVGKLTEGLAGYGELILRTDARRRMVVLLTLATLMAACSAGPVSADTGPDPVGTPGPTAAPTAPAHTADDVVLRISQTGGFAGPPSVPPPPPITVYSDGTMLSVDRPATNAPVSGVARLSRRQLTEAALGRLLYLAAKAGLTDRDHLDKPIPDAIVTVIAVRHGGRLNHSTFATFSPRPEDTPAQAQLRANAARFVRRLQNDPSTLLPTGISDPTPVPVDRLAMSAAALAPPALPEQQWPVTAVDLSTLGPCTVVRGPDAQAAADALARAPGGTRWGWQAQAWRVLAAPPVDDQPDCQPAAP